jgi:hypothetical protein
MLGDYIFLPFKALSKPMSTSAGSPSSGGFSACFPIYSWLVFRPQLTFFLSFILFFVLREASPNAALGILCLWSGLLAFWLERKVLNRILFPPFTCFAVWAALGTGIAIPLMVENAMIVGRIGRLPSAEFQNACLLIQCVHLLSFPIAWAGYYYGGFRKVCLPASGCNINLQTGRLKTDLGVLGWMLFIAAVALLAARVWIGIDDRGNFGPYGAAAKFVQFGPQIFLSLFPKLPMMGFVFLPLLWKSGGISGKTGIAVLFIVYLVFAISSGSRGLIAYPIFLILAGTYIFRSRDSKLFEMTLIALLVAGFLMTSFILNFRTAPEYQSSPSSYLVSRLSALGHSFRGTGFTSILASYLNYGTAYSLYGFEDPNVYGFTPDKMPHAGFSGFEAVPLTWVPSYFLRDKPVLLDAEYIAGSYLDPPIKMVGHGISLTADAYRRFGWIGVPVVVFSAFFLYGALCRWFLSWWTRKTLFGWALVAFAALFFWSRPFGTVLGTWWVFFYDTPKQLLALFLLCFCIPKCIDFASRVRARFRQKSNPT